MYSTTRTPSAPEKRETEGHLVRMDGVLFSNVNGNRRPQMHWRTDRTR